MSKPKKLVAMVPVKACIECTRVTSFRVIECPTCRRSERSTWHCKANKNRRIDDTQVVPPWCPYLPKAAK